MNNALRILTVFVIFGLLTGCARTTPTPVPTISVPPGVLTGRSGHIPDAQELLDLLVQEDFAAARERFSPDFRDKLTQQKLQEAWKKITSQAGPYHKAAAAKTELVDGREKVTLTSEFAKAYIDVKVFFDDEGQITGLFFAAAAEPVSFPEWTPPAYANPGAFVEIDIVVGSEEWPLPGTLTLPRGEGPFPAVVLVHGSGPQDRDETLGPNKPFRDLAWGLASQGAAVLRFDKRTLVHAEKLYRTLERLTVQEETVEDALLAVDLLRQTEKVDPERIFVLGHSLGGMLVPHIGARDPHITGFIILAGGARPLEDMILEQVTYILNLEEPMDENQQEQLIQIREQVERIKDPNLTSDTPPAELLGYPASYWLDLRGYDPPEQASALERPTLILQGDRDYQVTEVDFDRWQQALGDKNWAEFERYPSLNHLFIRGEGVITPAEYAQPGHVAEEVVNDIADWILSR